MALTAPVARVTVVHHRHDHHRDRRPERETAKIENDAFLPVPVVVHVSIVPRLVSKGNLLQKPRIYREQIKPGFFAGFPYEPIIPCPAENVHLNVKEK